MFSKSTSKARLSAREKGYRLPKLLGMRREKGEAGRPEAFIKWHVGLAAWAQRIDFGFVLVGMAISMDSPEIVAFAAWKRPSSPATSKPSTVLVVHESPPLVWEKESLMRLPSIEAAFATGPELAIFSP